ncbi:MAG: RagB/SusD family nutrient uptake outer membrane protein [Prevotella sp.]|nr:RagB/SusD family nutrient uptake outer membrane protein [Prevotella sp.]
MKKIMMTLAASLLLTTSCVDMDVAPKNVITADQLLSDESGMEIYMARLYSYMPYEDFKYQGQWGFNFNGWLVSIGIEGTGECLDRDGICRAFTGEDTPYWGMAFTELRDANFLLENLPKYRGRYPEAIYNHYLGEAYYVRAMVFTAMAKRFGGVPLVTKVIQYPDDAANLEVPRASEEETWDQILADYDRAIELLQPTSPKTGFSNKYKALAWKSEAMLYAGSVAKYNQTVNGHLTGTGQKTGVRVMGFAPERWEAASKKYFTEAYKAAKEIITSGKYSLYTKKWSATDKNAQYQNMVDMFFDTDSPENIDVREYSYPTTAHGYDAYNSPFVYHKPLSSGMCPTEDFCELFDGFERYADGSIRVTDGNSNATGHYIMYDNPMDIFKNVEPRLRANIIYPGDYFKDRNQELRTGTYVGSTPISPLFSDYSYATSDKTYQQLDAYTKKPKMLYLSPNPNSSQEQVPLEDGTTMNASGANGPFYANGEGSLTGLLVRKYLNPDPSAEIGEGKCDQHFVLMRYAEVLLNMAEAAVELSMAGVASPDGDNLLQQATEAVNKIRSRAGATLLTGTLDNTNVGRNIVRRERRKELAFEGKTKWDLRRWRVQHYDGREGFWGEERDKTTYSNNNQYRFRGLYPFYSTKDKKWFYDIHFQFISQKTFEYNVLDYY